MRKYLLSALVALCPNTHKETKSESNICQNNPIYCQIIKNNPKLERSYAMKLSNAIYHIAVLYNINPKKYAAILAQESMYKLNARNELSKDYGIAQINHTTAKSYGFNIKRLTTDLAYSLEAGAIVLSDFKKMYADKELEWWTRYNSSDIKKRKKYGQLVKRYL